MADKKDNIYNFRDSTVVASLESRYDFRDSTVNAAAEHQRAHPEAHNEALHVLQSQIHAQSQAQSQAQAHPHGHKTKDHAPERSQNPHSNSKTKPEHAAVHLATGNEENLEHPMHPEHHEQSS
ncbi:hypothetical protein BGZ82_008054 [Podila clonocystis]|nr:hypothetical protein BGZ82_008054 [Podila clonocystis]